MFEAKQGLCVRVSSSSVQGCYLLFHISHGLGLSLKERCTIVLCGGSDDLLCFILSKNTKMAKQEMKQRLINHLAIFVACFFKIHKI